MPTAVIVQAPRPIQKNAAGIHDPNGSPMASIIFVVATEYMPRGKTSAQNCGSYRNGTRFTP